MAFVVENFDESERARIVSAARRVEFIHGRGVIEHPHPSGLVELEEVGRRRDTFPASGAVLGVGSQAERSAGAHKTTGREAQPRATALLVRRCAGVDPSRSSGKLSRM